ARGRGASTTVAVLPTTYPAKSRSPIARARARFRSAAPPGLRAATAPAKTRYGQAPVAIVKKTPMLSVNEVEGSTWAPPPVERIGRAVAMTTSPATSATQPLRRRDHPKTGRRTPASRAATTDTAATARTAAGR